MMWIASYKCVMGLKRSTTTINYCFIPPLSLSYYGNSVLEQKPPIRLLPDDAIEGGICAEGERERREEYRE